MTIALRTIGLGERVRIFFAGVLTTLVIAAPVRADRSEVRSVMDAMQTAVLAGDKDAYLSHVWKDDANFLQEQKNWAADFDRHKPVKFEMIVSDDDESKFDDTEAHFTLRMQWSMGEEVPLGQERKVSFPVIFRKKDAQWLYGGEDWKVLEAPGVDGGAGARAKYLAGADRSAENVVAVLPEVRAHVDEGFGQKIDRVQEVKLYKSVKHLQASIYLSYTDGLGGWNEPKEAIKVYEPECREKEAAKALLAHEYGHCATFEYGPETSKMPWWVLEGVAELSSEYFRGDQRARDRVNSTVRRWSKSGLLAPWDEMADFHNCPKKWMGHVYTQGHHLLGYVSEKWERTGRNQWLRLMANGKTLDEATQEVMKMSFSDLDKQWRATLPAKESPDDHDK